MAKCEVWGNQYDKSFEVHQGSQIHTFDCFECPIHARAPICTHCGCRIIGHGLEAESNYYCCADCASEDGVHEFDDRIREEVP